MSKLLKDFDFKSKLKSLLLYSAIIFIIVNIVSYIKSPDLQQITPQINTKLINAQIVSLDDYKGKPLILHFWATWCPTCKIEAPVIESLSHDYQLLSIAVSSGSDEDLKKFMSENEYSFSVVNDKNGEISRAFGVKAFPTSFILNSKAEMIFSEVGYTSSLGFRARMLFVK